MAARDDSVIRGSLITCLILLVLSIASNIFLYLLADRRGTESTVAKDRLADVQTSVRDAETKLTRLKAMLGQGSFSEAELEEMKTNISGDPEIQAIEERFARDMSLFDANVEAQDRNYPALPEYLTIALRNRNEQFYTSQAQADTIRNDADKDVLNARKAQEIAESNAKQANSRVADLDETYKKERERINLEKENTRDRLKVINDDLNNLRKQAATEQKRLVDDRERLLNTIDNQKKRINEISNPQFEVAQGEIRSARRRVVTLNLGSADALRPNVTFGVIDRDEARLQDAKVKANIQVTRILGDHLAQATIISQPDVRSPIIPGDKVYSPFWAPGRTVRIALVGDIDIDGDGRADNDQIKGQIAAAGAQVVAEYSNDGTKTGDLDSSVRFMVTGTPPTIAATSSGFGDEDRNEELVRLYGNAKETAGELGITIIPGWKLDQYLKTIDGSLTTPLGSAIRGDDFLPPSTKQATRLERDISGLYKNQTEGLQRSLPPDEQFVAP